MARRLVADGGTASNMEVSCDSRQGVVPPAWGLGEVLTNPHRKIGFVTKREHVPRTWNGSMWLRIGAGGGRL